MTDSQAKVLSVMEAGREYTFTDIALRLKDKSRRLPPDEQKSILNQLVREGKIKSGRLLRSDNFYVYKLA